LDVIYHFKPEVNGSFFSIPNYCGKLKVLVPMGFSKTIKMIKAAGYENIEVDMSEFKKLDGGLSCLSLRF